MENKKHFSKLGLCLFIGSLLILVVQLIALQIAGNIPAITSNYNLNFLCGMLPMYIIAFPLIFLMFQKIPVQISSDKKKMSFGKLFIAFLMCYSITYIANFAGVICTTIIALFKPSGEVENVMMEITGSLHPAVNFFIVVICAPIMEELLFRKVLLSRTIKYGEGVSIVFSGLVFGLFHGNLNQFVYAFLLGIFFGFIYVKTRDIRYSIFLHMGINFMGSFIGAFILEHSGYMAIMEAATTGLDEAQLMSVMTENIGGLMLLLGYFFLLIVFVITGLVLFIVNFKKFKLLPGEVTIEKGKRFSTVILNVGMILYCLFWIAQIILQLIG